MLINTTKGLVIDTETGEITRDGTLVATITQGGPTMARPENYAGKIPSDARCLWATAAGSDKPTLVALAPVDAEAYDAAYWADRQAKADARRATPEGQREALVDAVIAARDRLDGAWSRESGNLAKTHADVAAAERALAEFDAAHPEVVAAAQAEHERRVQAAHGPAIERALRGED